jgi:hypothetical protein
MAFTSCATLCIIRDGTQGRYITMLSSSTNIEMENRSRASNSWRRAAERAHRRKMRGTHKKVSLRNPYSLNHPHISTLRGSPDSVVISFQNGMHHRLKEAGYKLCCVAALRAHSYFPRGQFAAQEKITNPCAQHSRM